MPSKPSIDLSGVKLLIVDLDNTLCDTFHSLSKHQWEKAVKALRDDGVDPALLDHLRKQLGKKSFRSSIEPLDERRKAIAIAAYDAVDVSKLRLYSDAQAILDVPLRKVLVTRGEITLQRAKIRHLKLRPHFAKVYHVPTFKEKREAFSAILKEFKVRPEETLVIGDRIEEEIKDGNSLGMHTAFIDRPDWPSHLSVARPDISVKNLEHLVPHLRGRPALRRAKR